MVSPTIWTNELRARVTVLWTDHTAKQISAVLACEGILCSRNAVIGIVNRMKLTVENKTLIHPLTRAKGIRQPYKPREKTYAKTKPTTVRLRVVNAPGGTGHNLIVKTINAVMPELRRVGIEPRNLPLIDLEKDDCRYIAGNDFLHCGHPQKPGSSFCPAHHAICWEPPNGPRAVARKYYGTDFARGAA